MRIALACAFGQTRHACPAFLPHVIESGEKSLIWIDGEVTHGVLKRAKSGDFRVQDDHGGTVAPLSLTQMDKTGAGHRDQFASTLCLSRLGRPCTPGWISCEQRRTMAGVREMVELWFDFIQRQLRPWHRPSSATHHLGLTDCGSGLRGAQRRFQGQGVGVQTKQQPGQVAVPVPMRCRLNLAEHGSREPKEHQLAAIAFDMTTVGHLHTCSC